MTKDKIKITALFIVNLAIGFICSNYFLETR